MAAISPMWHPYLNPRVLREPSWLHWAATVELLAANWFGASHAMMIAIGLCAAMTVYYYACNLRVRAYPVQIRVAYLALLGLGCLPYMSWIHAIQWAGTTAVVVFGYCPLHRMLTLAPWNRREPLSAALVWRAIAGPTAGGLFGRRATAPCAASHPAARPLPRDFLLAARVKRPTAA